MLAALAACGPGQPGAAGGSARPRRHASPPTAHPTPSRKTHSVASSSPGHVVPTVTICGAGPEVRPARFVLACADGNSVMRNTSWVSWTTTSARGNGTEWWDDCVPAYRCGLNARRHATVVLSRVVAGQFTRMRVYAGGRVLRYELPD